MVLYSRSKESKFLTDICNWIEEFTDKKNKILFISHSSYFVSGGDVYHTCIILIERL